MAAKRCPNDPALKSWLILHRAIAASDPHPAQSDPAARKQRTGTPALLRSPRSPSAHREKRTRRRASRLRSPPAHPPSPPTAGISSPSRVDQAQARIGILPLARATSRRCVCRPSRRTSKRERQLRGHDLQIRSQPSEVPDVVGVDPRAIGLRGGNEMERVVDHSACPTARGGETKRFPIVV